MTTNSRFIVILLAIVAAIAILAVALFYRPVSTVPAKPTFKDPMKIEVSNISAVTPPQMPPQTEVPKERLSKGTNTNTNPTKPAPELAPIQVADTPDYTPLPPTPPRY
jgi:hypothetical protein